MLFILEVNSMDDNNSNQTESIEPVEPVLDIVVNGLEITLINERIQLINDELHITFTCEKTIQEIYNAFNQGISELEYDGTVYSEYETLKTFNMKYDNIGQQIYSASLQKTHLVIENEEETKFALERAKETLSDEDALQCISIFDLWMLDMDYKKDQRIRYNDVLYKVLQDHHSQIDWTPDKAVSLFVDIADPADPWPEWVRPTMAEDAYALGAQVTHNGKKYISQIDANTTEPGTDERWWKEVTEEES